MASEYYDGLLRGDLNRFAWEWLRRNAIYQKFWHSVTLRTGHRRGARLFGLERYEDPRLDYHRARPLWTAAIDPRVLHARVFDVRAPAGERVDLRELSSLVSILVDEDDVEHVLLSNGDWGLRIDILAGTLIGCPASLTYSLDGIRTAQKPLIALQRLIALSTIGRVSLPSDPNPARRGRWIQELRVADALLAGATHQEIARILFKSSIAGTTWRSESDAYRQRTQRLIRNAKHRLLQPLDRRWFCDRN